VVLTYERSDWEEEAISGFLARYFPDTFLGDQSTLPSADGADEITDAEQSEIDALLERAEEYFGTSKGALGVALDFLMVAEQLSQRDDWVRGFEPDIERADILDRYGNAAKTTLTPKYDGERYGIRPVHNNVIDLFREDLSRTNFPSSPGHHTGEWERYDDMLESAFRLSRAGRYEAAQRLFHLGLEELESKDYERREPPFPQPFLRVLQDYERSAPFEQGGSAYQALCYGFVKANWPHLSLRASKVRTGSSRQNRYGDIDGFYGPDLMISVEVKDLDIDRSNVESELGTMMGVAENTTAIAIAICRSVEADARATLEGSGVRVLDDNDLEERLEIWDYHKQNRALQGMIHFLTNIEENPDAAQRLLSFIDGIDSNNSALAHLKK
jgi:hypothetical protein